MVSVPSNPVNVSERRRSRKSGRPTIRDVAREAGVSAITVSRALRDASQVSASARAGVEAAVERLGYVANRAAGTLAGATSNIVPVLVPRIHNAFFSETIEAIAEAFSPHAIDLLVAVHGYDLARECAEVRSFLAWNPAAVILTGTDHLPATRALLRAARVPVVEVWDIAGKPIDVAVGFSHTAAGEAIGRYCIDAGFRRAAFVGAYLDRDLRARRRLEGFAQAFGAGRSSPEVVSFPGPATVDQGAEAIDRLLRRPRIPDVVACSNDVIALGALFECQRRGVAVPEGLSVIGFGDQPASRQCVPSLTTVRPRGVEIGALAAREILDRLAAGRRTRRARVRDTGFEIVERESVRTRRPLAGRREASPVRRQGAGVVR
jgi:LacI family gluconate utilization system Gnt-I transcriptional repressor